MKKLYSEMSLRELRREMRFLRFIEKDVYKGKVREDERDTLALYLCEQANNIEFLARLRAIDYIINYIIDL